MNDKIYKDMKNIEFSNSIESIKTVLTSDSWFRDTPHYWVKASLPLAYSIACVEIVSSKS